MTAALLIAYLALQTAFIWGRYVHFKTVGTLPRGARLIEASVAAILTLGSWLIVTREAAGAASDALATGCAACSAALFLWALASTRRRQLTLAFTNDSPTELIQDGAYAFVRNPFYAAYLLGFGVPFAATGSLWGLISLGWMLVIYWRAAVAEERKFASSNLGAAYERYAKTTGRFLPRPATCARLLRRMA